MPRNRYSLSLILSVLGILPLTAFPCAAADRVTFQRDGHPHEVTGEVVITAKSGGLMLRDREGVIWLITAEELRQRDRNDEPFALLDEEELKERLQRELPNSFRFHTTAHYVICYNTSEAYARWCGALFERLFLAFRNYWSDRDFDFKEPDAPLVALVFNNKSSFGQYARRELGEATSNIFGYYSFETNRMTMYDLTGSDRLRNFGRLSSAEHVNRLLAQPQAERTVATIIHEATHQLAYNCGLQTRYADNPYWVSEGIAIFFETPDLRSKRGWRKFGSVNRVRLNGFQRYLRTRPRDSLRTLIRNDERFQQTATASDAYAEAWALTYFLIRQRKESYIAYLKKLSEKRPLVFDTPEERIAQFESAFGDLEELDAKFLRYALDLR